MLAIGLMSGTSLDGMDAILVEIDNEQLKPLKFVTLPYDESFKKIIMRNLSDETAKLSEISSLNFEIGNKSVEAIDLLLKDTKFKYQDISFIASHGQTIWHDPKGIKSAIHTPSTLQIGEPSVISYKTGIKTISNFRTMDIACGGEGAPLVPYSEYMLFKSKDKNIVLQNIGGIGNLTYLKKNCSIEEVYSFDTGPGNIMIDYFVNKYYKLPFDKNGDIANSGRIVKTIFDYLLKDKFITKIPPKSTGREQYSKEFMEHMAEELNFKEYDTKDIICTLTEFTAYTISYQYLHFIKDIDLVVVSGGGSHNKYIMRRIEELTNIKTITGEEFGIDSDSKEALAFVILGYLTLMNKPSNVKSATGAKDYVILGNITPNPLGYKNE